MKILHIEDNENDFLLVRSELQSFYQGLSIQWVKNRSELISSLKGFDFQCILADYNLPDIDGVEVIEILRPHIEETPIIIVSGSAKEEWVAKIIRAGAYDFVVKTDLERLPYTINRALESQKIIEKNQEQEKTIRLQTAALEATSTNIFICDASGRILWCNQSLCRETGYSKSELIGRKPSIFKSGQHDESYYEQLWQTVKSGQVWESEVVNKTKPGHLLPLLQTITPIKDDENNVVNFVSVSQNVQRLNELHQIISRTQRLEAIGQLASGIAHEINTPIQYIGDNTRFVLVGINDLLGLIQVADHPDAFKQMQNQVDLDFLVNELPKAVEQTLEGVEHVARIVKSMKDFAHPGSSKKQLVDLNDLCVTVIEVSRNEWKYVANMERDFEPGLPRVRAVVNEINQVMLNLVVNAAHAIEEKKSENSMGVITIKTWSETDYIVFSVKDDGSGIPYEIQTKIFNPFFTTKEVGRGTGQGLALVHRIVHEKHGGIIELNSIPGQGTDFVIKLPRIDT